LDKLSAELKRVNAKLWDVEDAIRDCEARSDFGEPFIELARTVYRLNDERSRLKKAINLASGSRLVEEKSYKSYQREDCDSSAAALHAVGQRNDEPRSTRTSAHPRDHAAAAGRRAAYDSPHPHLETRVGGLFGHRIGLSWHRRDARRQSRR